MPEWATCVVDGPRGRPETSACCAAKTRLNIVTKYLPLTCNRQAFCSELMNESVHQALSNIRRRNIMTMKHILAVALVAPFLTVSGMAQEAPRIEKHVYQGGPNSTVPGPPR